jgi:XTP/dITP diphosphohydrolase
MPDFELLIGTRNHGKVREIQETLKDLPLKLHVLEEFPGILAPVESGASYEENASIKARSYASQTGLWALAEDSGLEVAALAGAPGLRSARFGGDQASDSERMTLLLSSLSDAGTGTRLARFICAAAIAEPSGSVIHTSRGSCDGRIATTPAGVAGFGFDPVFIPEGHDVTFAEMPALVKNQISHRANALAATRRFLSQILGRNC